MHVQARRPSGPGDPPRHKRRLSESAYAVEMQHHLYETPEAAWKALKEALPHALDGDDVVIVQELCGDLSGVGWDTKSALGFRAAPNWPVVVSW